MKFAILTIAIFITGAAHAGMMELTVQCTRNSTADCATRTVAAFQKIGCNPDPQSVECDDGMQDDSVDPESLGEIWNKDICRVASDCSEPTYGSWWKLVCQGASVDLLDADPGITTTMPIGLIRHFDTQLCVLN